MKIFISYSHKDENYKIELLKQLSNLQRDRIIDGWHDGKIKPGDKWDDSIKKALYESEIVLFLISADFMASDYINNTEIKISLERYVKKEIQIVPIILRPCLWQESEFGQFQVLPKDAKPLAMWKDIDEGLLDITKGIIKIIKKNDRMKKEEKQITKEEVKKYPKEKNIIDNSNIETEGSIRIGDEKLNNEKESFERKNIVKNSEIKSVGDFRLGDDYDS